MNPARVLVLANRTVDSDELREALRARSEQGPIDVTLLVPAVWEIQDPHGGFESAQRRIHNALERMRDDGLRVGVRIGDPDPLTALRDAWRPDRYDELIVSTLPSRISKWLHIDLPGRAEKVAGVPVSHVVANERGATSASRR